MKEQIIFEIILAFVALVLIVGMSGARKGGKK
jgi:hypothetical protein